jgi:hypothetical protein
VRQQGNRGVLPRGRLAHYASLSVAFESLGAALANPVASQLTASRYSTRSAGDTKHWG